MTKPDEGQAFPKISLRQKMMKDGIISPVPGMYIESCSGMTLRQWYAGMAMQAIIASPRGLELDGVPVSSPEATAKCAFSQADAMITQEDKC